MTVPAVGGTIVGALAVITAVAVIWRRGPLLGVSLFGRRATGTVVGVDRNDGARPRLRIAYVALDGTETEFREPIAVKAKAEECLPVRYGRRNPAVATSARPIRMVGEVLAFGVVFGLCGLITFIGSVDALAGGDQDTFYGLVGLGFFVLLAAVLLYVATQAYARARSSRSRVLADGVVRRVAARKSGGSYPHPWVAYDTRGGARVEYWDVALTGYAPGDPVAVYYDPEFPELTSTGVDRAGYTWRAAFFGVVGLLCLLAGTWSAWAYLISG